MAYIKIGGIDCSQWCNELKITSNKNYNAQTNASGDTVIDLIKTKRTIEVGLIQLDTSAAFKGLLAKLLEGNSIIIEYQDPITDALVSVVCFIADDTIDYYTIQTNKITYKPFKLKFTEL